MWFKFPRTVNPVTFVQVRAEAVGAELIAMTCKPDIANASARKLLRYLRLVLAEMPVNWVEGAANTRKTDPSVLIIPAR
jgi:hypothetical protein